MGRVIIVKRNGRLVLFLMDGAGHPQMIQTAPCDREETPGNIYIGRVSEIASGIQAAFVTITRGEKVFLPLSECENPLLTGREYDGRLKAGDELLIQISAKAIKSKLPCATTRLSLTGKYCVCHMKGNNIFYSGKLSDVQVQAIKEAVKDRKICDCQKYGFIIRTNTGALDDFTPLFEEMECFISIFNEILAKYKFRTCYTCLYSSKPEIVTILQNISVQDYDEVVTDSEEAYKMLTPFFSDNLRWHQDPMISLTALYSLKSHLGRALDKKVWLPSGGYLVIEPTEAMVVIDVNSGKASGEKRAEKENLYLRTNLEAAIEIARQLRLRNYSGMIMVDFINMELKENNRQLMRTLDEQLRKDKIKTKLVDMTALGIVEITRKKVSRPLADFFCCEG